MIEAAYTGNAKKVQEAFDRQSAVFDSLYSPDAIIAYKRKRVRDHVMQFLKPPGSILELNAGTGEDSIYFAKQSFQVHATDISSRMLSVINDKTESLNLCGSITTEQCSFTSLHRLKNKGPYDLIFSNFAGINCTDGIDQLLNQLSGLLKPGGFVTLVFLPPFCLWEFLMVFKGKFKTAFRRFCGKRGANACIESINFRCWYYHPSSIIRKLKPGFNLIGYEGLCICVPPSGIENFAEKHPRLYGLFKREEEFLKCRYPWKFVGDYVILSFKKRV